MLSQSVLTHLKKSFLLSIIFAGILSLLILSGCGDIAQKTNANTIAHAPVINSLTANPATVATGETSTLTCLATDADNDPLIYSWSADSGIISNGTISGSNSTATWTAPATAGTYTYQEPNLMLSNDCYLTKDIKNWSAYLMEKDNEAVIDDIRQHTKTGRPCGNKSFIETIERLLERTLTALPRGRPCKEK